MKAAFSAWNNRIAPVFDVTRQVLLVEAQSGRIVRETRESLGDDIPAQRALRLARFGIDTLICGAISRPMQAMVAAYGIRVIPFVAGDLREVIQAWLCDGLKDTLFAMPGCCGRGRRRRRGTSGMEKEEYIMNGGNRGGRGLGGGQGQGGQRFGRMGGPSAAGPGGYCVCVRCGYQEPHERGVPCTQRQCPKCGASMTRQ
ncbi:MAG: NifB/NifX family molybdenum-iron cluster-binding protein [bacterium]